jgi:hypothetical protein
MAALAEVAARQHEQRDQQRERHQRRGERPAELGEPAERRVAQAQAHAVERQHHRHEHRRRTDVEQPREPRRRRAQPEDQRRIDVDDVDIEPITGQHPVGEIEDRRDVAVERRQEIHQGPGARCGERGDGHDRSSAGHVVLSGLGRSVPRPKQGRARASS